VGEWVTDPGLEFAETDADMAPAHSCSLAPPDPGSANCPLPLAPANPSMSLAAWCTVSRTPWTPWMRDTACSREGLRAGCGGMQFGRSNGRLQPQTERCSAGGRAV
jgi:hypothetical protein